MKDAPGKSLSERVQNLRSEISKMQAKQRRLAESIRTRQLTLLRLEASATFAGLSLPAQTDHE